MSDLRLATQFFAAVTLLSLAGYPLSHRLFRLFPDRGWFFAKTIGTLLVGWVLWFGTYVRVLRITAPHAVAVALAVGGVSWLVAHRQKRLPPLREARDWIAIETLLYLACFGGWTYLRGYAPDLVGLEKFMDYGFMNSILKGGVMPPANHFLAGEPINYYYYGHFLAALHKLLAFVPAPQAYNLEMSHLMGLCATHSFSLGAFASALLRRGASRAPSRGVLVSAGLLSTVFVTLLGNAQALYQRVAEPEKEYWFPNATRFIAHSIHEFPFYSFLVNDLHAHVTNIPNALVAFALAWALFLEISDGAGAKLPERLTPRAIAGYFWRTRFGYLLLAQTFVIGTSYFTNAWDLPVYLALTGAAIWAAFGQNTPHERWGKRLFAPMPLVLTAVSSVLLVTLGILWYLPHWLSFKAIARGVGVVPAAQSTPSVQLLVFWAIHLSPCVLLAHHALGRESPLDSRVRPIFAVPLILVALLIAAPEFIYLRDINTGDFRANTMFKFFYQAWLWSGMLAAVALVHTIEATWRMARARALAYAGFGVALVLAGFYYARWGVRQEFGELGRPRGSVDGLAFLRRDMPDDLRVIEWLRANVEGQPTLAEGVGDSYTEYARIATFSGLPTVLGWPVHVWLWNGSVDKPLVPRTVVQKKTARADTVMKRVADVRALYETESAAKALALIAKYDIRYIVVAPLERKKYAELKEDKFREIADVVFAAGESRLYRVR